MIKAYKYCIKPNDEQKVLIEKHFGCCRFVYNYGLDKKIKAYELDKSRISCFDLINEVVGKKQELEWLKEVASQALQMSLRNLDNAFTNFFRKNAKFPKFKSKHNSKQSCQFPQGVRVYFDKGIIKLPKMGEVKCIFDRTFEGKIGTTTLSKKSTGKYFVSILVEDNKELPKKKKITKASTLGIDVGIKTFATLSDGTKIDYPNYLRSNEKRLKVLQKRFSKKKKCSQNRNDAKLKLAKAYESVTNKRKDFLHKLSHSLVCENQATMFVCEDLNIKGMVRNHHLAKSISDCSWGTFMSFLEYKCEWYGKTFIKIGRFEASSKICNECGYTNHNLTLKDRQWQCLKCNAKLDRDLNAAINIKKMGYIRFRGTGNELKQGSLEQSSIS